MNNTAIYSGSDDDKIACFCRKIEVYFTSTGDLDFRFGQVNRLCNVVNDQVIISVAEISVK